MKDAPLGCDIAMQATNCEWAEQPAPMVSPDQIHIHRETEA